MYTNLLYFLCRAGNKGWAYTFLTPEQGRYAGDITRGKVAAFYCQIFCQHVLHFGIWANYRFVFFQRWNCQVPKFQRN